LLPTTLHLFRKLTIMLKHHRISLLASVTGVALVASLAACSSIPEDNAALNQARTDYRSAQANPLTVSLAPAELKVAGDALNVADAAYARQDKRAEVDQLAYLARQRVAIAQELAGQRGAERSVADASAARDKMRLTARTQEADAAHASADSSKAQAQASQTQAQAALTQADMAHLRNQQLEAQVRELNAKQTDRGLVITLGDVLFDTNQASLKSGGQRNLDKLVTFLQQNPERRALIEGFTDSTGSDETNQALSARRADAVRAALLNGGVAADRVSTKAYGEAFPVASNDKADGRQMNRRVEIVLSDLLGEIKPR
jgi:outer membrane protein OmpA-like peptidoglycan-associated protein